MAPFLGNGLTNLLGAFSHHLAVDLVDSSIDLLHIPCIGDYLIVGNNVLEHWSISVVLMQCKMQLRLLILCGALGGIPTL